jgi:hypothetical protein
MVIKFKEMSTFKQEVYYNFQVKPKFKKFII